MNLSFQTIAEDGLARTGRFVCAHGEVETPIFMPVGTQATVKGVMPRDLREVGARIVLGNTYHLYLRPGHERIRALGGLHAFMGWPGPILTDSGGYQVLSLSSLRDIEEAGVRFRSHIDGSSHQLTPELAMEVQAALGSDIAMPLDVCPPAGAARSEVESAVLRSLRWLDRCVATRSPRSAQALFGIVQGGVDPELRRRSVEETVARDLDGNAIGGLAVGEEKPATFDTIAATVERLPADRPRYVMGMGTPLDLVEAVALGVDMFDSVLPTRNARNAGVFTSEGRLNLRNARFRDDAGPLDESCDCYACRNFCRAYLRHLVVARELLAPVLLTLHNLRYFLDSMGRIRQAITSHRFDALRREYRSIYGKTACLDA